MKPTVLIVEDEAPLVTLLRYNLEKEGFAVCSAGDGEEALLQIAENKPDAVLLDWMLPLVSGLEVCRQIRRSPASRALPIILLTARGEEADRVRGLDSGADDYIVKPFSPSELVARLRAVIRRAQPSAADDTLHYADVAMDLAAYRALAGRSISGRPNSAYCTTFCSIPAASSRASTCSTGSGVRMRKSRCARWTCTSAGFAKRSTLTAAETWSARSARSATRSTTRVSAS